MSDKETVLPVSLCSSLFADVSVSGGISTCSLSSSPTILCVCSSSFVRRVSRDEIAFLLELDWLMDSLYISCSWQQTDSILWHKRSKIESIVSLRVKKIYRDTQPDEICSHLSERRQKAGFLIPRSSKITVTEEKEKKERARKRKGGEENKSNGCTLSFYNS